MIVLHTQWKCKKFLVKLQNILKFKDNQMKLSRQSLNAIQF